MLEVMKDLPLEVKNFINEDSLIIGEVGTSETEDLS